VSTPAVNLDAALDLVEARLEAIVGGSDELVLRYLAEVSKGRGKRIRPRLMLAVGSLFSTDALPALVNSAACCELVHTGSLIHDDVIDEAPLRRGLPTLNGKFGNEAAVIVGDYVLALAMDALAAQRNFRLIDMMLATSKQVGLGVLQEILNRNNFRLGVETYFDVIHYKTAALFALCGEMGAYLGGADETGQAQAREYGTQYGMAFQVVDDLLDLTQDPAVTGKPSLSDLREGRITLPLIHALGAEPEETRGLIESFQREHSPSVERSIRSHLERLGSIEFAYREAQAFLGRARELAGELATSAPRPDAAVELERLESRVVQPLPARAAVLAS